MNRWYRGGLLGAGLAGMLSVSSVHADEIPPERPLRSAPVLRVQYVEPTPPALPPAPPPAAIALTPPASAGHAHPAAATASSEGWFAVREVPYGSIGEWCGSLVAFPRLKQWLRDGEGPPHNLDDPTWFGIDYVTGWFREARLPPLLTTSPQTDPDPAVTGVLNPDGTALDAVGRLGFPGTTVLYGGSDLGLKQHHGVRFTYGTWFEPTQSLGIEANYFFLANRGVHFAAGSDGTTLLARPYFAAPGGVSSAVMVSSQGYYLTTGDPNLDATDVTFDRRINGIISIDYNSRLQGSEIHLLTNWIHGTRGRIDLLGGFRYLHLDEALTTREQLFIPVGAANGGSLYSVFDQFGTENNVFTAQIGARGQYRLGRWGWGGFLKFGLGWNRMLAKVNGGTGIANVDPLVPTVNQVGGVLAQPTNFGRFERTQFLVVPEFGLTASYDLFDHCRLFASYNFLLLTNVMRPGQQIDLNLNPNLLPPSPPDAVLGPPPVFPFGSSSFWVHTLNLGLEISY